MIRVTLFSEFNGGQFYGEDLLDAFRRVRGIRMSDGWDKVSDVPVRGREIEVSQVIGELDVTSSTRGCSPFRAVLVELVDGQVLQIDCVCAEMRLL
jgi:hypothetical protein